MTLILRIFIILIFFYYNVALANTFVFKNFKISIQNSKRWEEVEGFFGNDLSLLSEPSNLESPRSMISIYDSNVQINSIPSKEMLKEKSSYFLGRKKFIESESGQFLKELSSREFIQSYENNGIELSFEYALENQKYREYSYYMNCNNNFIFIKGLIVEKDFNSSNEKYVKEVVSSIRCEKKTVTSQKTLNKNELNKIFEKINQKKNLAIVIKKLRKFMIAYEGGSTEDPPVPEEPVELDSLININNIFKVNECFAGSPYVEGGNCIFGGWVSHFTKKQNGKLSCENPKNSNPHYNNNNTCNGENSFQCNPVLFGSGVCVNGTDKDFLQSATFYCDSHKKSENEIIDYSSKNIESVKKLIGTTNELCASNDYLSNNVDLCGKLIQQLKQISENEIDSELDLAENAYNNFIAKKELKPEEYEDADNIIEKQLQLFEKACMTGPDTYRSGIVQISDDSGENSSTINCDAEKKALIQNLKKLQRAEIKENESDDSNLNEVCHIKPKETLQQGADLNAILENTGCKVKPKSCLEDAPCLIWGAITGIGSAGLEIIERLTNVKSSNLFDLKGCKASDNNCSVQAASAIAKGLWSTLSGLWDLGVFIKDAFSATGTAISNLWNNTKVEDESSKKIRQMSKIPKIIYNEFKKSPKEFIKNTISGFLNGVNEWVANDLYCMQWSGVPRASNCLKPMPSFECLDCKSKLMGTCAALGYVAEKAGEIFGGIWLAGYVKGASFTKNLSQNVGKFLVNASKKGKLLKVESSILKIVPKALKIAKKTVKATKKLKKYTTNIIKKPFKLASTGFKYLGNKTVTPLLKQISNLKVVAKTSAQLASKFSGSIAEKIILKSVDYKNYVKELSKKIQDHGFATSQRLTSPRKSVERELASTTTSTQAAAQSSDKINLIHSKTNEPLNPKAPQKQLSTDSSSHPVEKIEINSPTISQTLPPLQKDIIHDVKKPYLRLKEVYKGIDSDKLDVFDNDSVALAYKQSVEDVKEIYKKQMKGDTVDFSKLMKGCADNLGNYRKCITEFLESQIHPEDLKYIKDYTGSGYVKINNALRKNTFTYEEKKAIEAIDRNIQKFKMKEKDILFRWTDTPDDVLAKLKKANLSGKPEVIDKGYMSATYNPDGTQGFVSNAKNKTLIITETNQSLGVAPVSNYAKESEKIIARNQPFKISKVETNQSICQSKNLNPKTSEQINIVIAQDMDSKTELVMDGLISFLCH